MSERRRASLLRFATRRVLLLGPFASLLVVAAFTLIQLAPGDPILLLAGDGGTPAYYAELRAYYGLDRPLPVQLTRYAGALLRGDLGQSLTYQRPVAGVVLDRLPATLVLGFAALVVGVGAGLGLGLLAVQRPHGRMDGAIRLWTSIAYATPVFWLAQGLLLLFAVKLAWLPLGGMTSVRDTGTALGGVVDVLRHLLLPALALGLSLSAVTGRVARASLLDALQAPFVLAARARGASHTRVLLRHALPNAVIPVVTVVGHHAGSVLSGAALTEVVFAWPGLGKLLLDASLQRDVPLAMGVFLVGMVSVVVANVVVDITYHALDPRLELR
ncbi:MAG: ABC transporter permease [Cytophagaceae bacterium]|nr:ABC transporter permease [Gemmatimonadaceae bacterium]